MHIIPKMTRLLMMFKFLNPVAHIHFVKHFVAALCIVLSCIQHFFAELVLYFVYFGLQLRTSCSLWRRVHWGHSSENNRAEIACSNYAIHIISYSILLQFMYMINTHNIHKTQNPLNALSNTYKANTKKKNQNQHATNGWERCVSKSKSQMQSQVPSMRK